MRKSIAIVLILSILSCTKKKEIIPDRKIDSLAAKLKKEDLITIKEYKKYHLIDSLSDKEYSRVKLFLDSLKVYDTIKYFALRKVIEGDTVDPLSEYYNDKIKNNYYLFFVGEPLNEPLNDSDYKNIAKNQLINENK